MQEVFCCLLKYDTDLLSLYDEGMKQLESYKKDVNNEV